MSRVVTVSKKNVRQENESEDRSPTKKNAKQNISDSEDDVLVSKSKNTKVDSVKQNISDSEDEVVFAKPKVTKNKKIDSDDDISPAKPKVTKSKKIDSDDDIPSVKPVVAKNRTLKPVTVEQINENLNKKKRDKIEPQSDAVIKKNNNSKTNVKKVITSETKICNRCRVSKNVDDFPLVNKGKTNERKSLLCTRCYELNAANDKNRNKSDHAKKKSEHEKKPEVRAAYLERKKKQVAAKIDNMTPEELEAYNLKKKEQWKKYRENKKLKKMTAGD